MTAARTRQIVVALFVLWTCICIFVPFTPSMPGAGLDESWRFGVNQAVAQHLRFGPEFTFTYGPYVSVVTTEYSPATDAMMLGAGMLLALTYATAIIFLAGVSRLHWGVLAVLLLSRMFVVADVLFFSLVLLVAMCIHKLALVDGRKPRLWALIFLACFVLGILPLIKGTFLLISGAALGCCFVFLLSRGQRLFAWGTVVAFACGVPVFWVASGQSLVDLPSYLANLVPIMSGYTDAMSIKGDASEPLLYALSSVVLLLAVLVDPSLSFPSRYLLIALYSLYLFIVFKGGFVRHDGHALLSGVCLILGAVFLFLVSRTRVAYVALLLSFVTWMTIDAHFLTSSTGSGLASRSQTSSSTWGGIRARLDHPEQARRQYDDAVKKISAATPFPSLAGTTDIYSYNQSELIASGNRWSPRPTFQSYSAYTPSLLERNRQHLSGPGAPDHVIFRVEPIDDRFPATEDGASWPELIARYRPVEFKQEYLFLDRQSNPASPDLEVVGTPITAKRNERVEVPDPGGLMFARIAIKKTLFGKIASLLYKPEPLSIEVYFADSTHKAFRLVSAMADSPFLVSPLVSDTKDFLLLYGEAELLSDKKVRALTVATSDASSFTWQNEFTVQFLRRQPQPAARVISLLGLEKFGGQLTAALPLAAHCDGNIDVLNDKPVTPTTLSSRAIVKLRGWMTSVATGPDLPDAVYAVLTDSEGKATLLKTARQPRPDVAAYFNNPAIAGSGFTAAAELTGFSGDYFLGIAIEKKGLIIQCPQFRVAVTIK